MKKEKFEPDVSKDLQKTLEGEGTLKRFLNDYRQMSNNFKPSKIYIPGKEPKPLNYDELDNDQRGILEKLGKAYAHATHTLLEFGTHVDKEIPYALIGGFGVLGHLYQHNQKFPLKWRGTEDIDILSRGNLRPTYNKIGLTRIPQERVDTSMIPDGVLKTFIRQNPYIDDPVKIQDRATISFPRGRRRDESSLVLGDRRLVNMYGVPLSVASPDHLITTKTGIRTRRGKLGHLKDAHDIEHLKNIKKITGS